MSGHEIYKQSTEITGLTFSGGELKIKETSEFSGYGIRVLDDGRLGFAYCQDKSGLDNAKERAQRISRFSAKSGFSFAPESSFRRPDIFDPDLDPYDSENLKGLLNQAKDAAESFGARVKISITAQRSSTGIENTEGFSGGYDQTGFSVYAECMHGDGLGLSYLSSNKLEDVRETGLRAAGMAKDMQGAKKPESGNYTVVTQIEALESLLETFLPSFSGDWKRRGITRLEKGQRFSEMITICEDGLAKGTSARPFDDEGTPSEKRSLVKDGVVEDFLYDRETAALAGVDSSGACAREAYDDNPSIGSSNILLSPGTWNDLGEIGRYIELHYAHGAHTANLTTGDIGLEVTAAFMVEREKRTPLKGFMLTGNIFDMFRDIEAVESKTRNLGWLTAPRIAFGNVHVVS